jgi:hypothetical protein
MPLLARLIFSSMLWVAASAVAADQYEVTIGEPLPGTSMPRGRVGLGIAVNIDKNWDGLSEADRAAWREYTEMTDADVTPPFPLPHIRSFLKKLDTYDFPVQVDEQMIRSGEIMLVVRVSDTGKVSQVEVMDASKDGSGTMTHEQKILATRYVVALLATPFSPAKYKGQTAPSAFIMRIRHRSVMG